MKPRVFCRVLPVGGDGVFLQLFCITDNEMLPLTPAVASNLKQIDESPTSEPFSGSGLNVKWLCIWSRDHSFGTRTWPNTLAPCETLPSHQRGRPPPQVYARTETNLVCCVRSYVSCTLKRRTRYLYFSFHAARIPEQMPLFITAFNLEKVSKPTCFLFVILLWKLDINSK